MSEQQDKERREKLKQNWLAPLAGFSIMAVCSLTPGYAYFEPNMLLFGLVLYMIMPIMASMFCCHVAVELGMKKSPAMYGVTTSGLLMGTICVLLLGLDGLICVVMAFPLAMLMTVVGTALYLRKDGKMGLLMAPAGLLALGGDVHRINNEPILTVETRTKVSAPPSEVWPLIIQQPDLHETRADWLVGTIKAAHPTATLCADASVGAQRNCRLTTGDMHEVVTETVPNRRFAFRVLNTPPAMKETNPLHPDIHPGHLEGYVEMRTGSFDLIETADGTEIVARSTYVNRYGPLAYWRLWSDAIVSGVHKQVLHNIKEKVE